MTSILAIDSYSFLSTLLASHLLSSNLLDSPRLLAYQWNSMCSVQCGTTTVLLMLFTVEVTLKVMAPDGFA